MHTIDIRLRQIEQLFDSLDPSPFHDKALDRDAEAYLFECAGEFPAGVAMELLVHGPAALGARSEDIASAIHRHFALLLSQAERRHRRRMRVARIAILFGAAVLAAALLLRAWIVDWGGGAGDVLSEGLLILAWVALWRPAEMALFDRWEQRDEMRLLRALARVPVRFQADAEAA